MQQPIHNILDIQGLCTSFQGDAGTRPVRILDQVCLTLKQGKTLGIVGESGCGKSVLGFSIMRLLPKPHGTIDSGSIFVGSGENALDVLKLGKEELYSFRGKKAAMIFQEPMTALNPVQTIGKQLAECFEMHRPELATHEIKNECVKLLSEVGIPLPENRFNEYPHQLSGGMRQRVVIAMALAMRPELIIADEPTTALDVTIQAQILDLLKKLQKEQQTSLVLITHDLGVIAEMCDDVAVMYCGQVVEHTDVFTLFENPKHPYTQLLLQSIPRLNQKERTPLHTIEGLVPDFRALPTGCRFQNRCPWVTEACQAQAQELKNANTTNTATHLVRCCRHAEITLKSKDTP